MESAGQPPTIGSEKKVKRMNATNGAAVRDAAWRIVIALTLAGVLGVAAMLWSVNAKIAVIDATMITDTNPPQWFRDQVQRIDTNLQEHMRQTAQEAHRGGV